MIQSAYLVQQVVEVVFNQWLKTSLNICSVGSCDLKLLIQILRILFFYHVLSFFFNNNLYYYEMKWTFPRVLGNLDWDDYAISFDATLSKRRSVYTVYVTLSPLL